MAAQQPPVVLYHFEISPMGRKTRNMLALKHIPHKRADVGMIMPRPALSERLGIAYRRIPVLAIGGDVYCDSALIASTLERRFPPLQGYASLFPNRTGSKRADVGLAKVLGMYYFDRVMFPLGTASMPMKEFGKAFIVDRRDYFTPGIPLDPEKLEGNKPVVKSTFSSHLAWMEEQLADGRAWLLDTETPGLVDIAAHAVWLWMRDDMFPDMQDMFDSAKYGKTLAWIERVSAYILTSGKDISEDIDGNEAGRIVCAAPTEDLGIVGFDTIEASRLDVGKGDLVAVTPTDTGLVSTIGKLLALNQEEAVIETSGSAGTVHAHFPRLMFSIVRQNL